MRIRNACKCTQYALSKRKKGMCVRTSLEYGLKKIRHRSEDKASSRHGREDDEVNVFEALSRRVRSEWLVNVLYNDMRRA